MQFRKLRDYWHDFYYAVVPESGVLFAMKCKDVAAKIDLGEIPEDFVGRLRFRLHLSLCSACRYYRDATLTLGVAIRKLIFKGEKSVDLETLNKKLLKRFSKSA